MPDQHYNTGDGLTPVVHHGDADDVKHGRACPHCRGMLTGHNKAVWDAGYAVGARHESDRPDGTSWTALDDSPEASAQMIQWHAPETFAAIVAWAESRAGSKRCVTPEDIINELDRTSRRGGGQR